MNNTIKYIHLRRPHIFISKSGRFASSNCQDSPKGGVTVAYTQEDSDFIVAFAACRTDDSYDKAIGRMHSAWKLSQGLSVHTRLNNKDSITTQLIKLVYNMPEYNKNLQPMLTFVNRNY